MRVLLAALARGLARGRVSVCGGAVRHVSSCPATPTCSFTVVPCLCCDEDRVLEFMCRTFYREEPSLLAAGLAFQPGAGRAEPPQVLLDHTRSSFREGLSLMALTLPNQESICGVAINSIVAPGDACKLKQQAAAEKCPATKKTLELWALMLEHPEIWTDPDASCMLELRELATDKAFQGRGVGLQLALASREVAANVGAPAFKIDCTSHYSAKIAQKLGMQKVVSLRYAEMTDPDGKPLFNPQRPHEEIAVYTQKLSKDCQQKFGGEF